MSESIEKTIDIDKILKSKMGSKVKFVPRFLVSWSYPRESAFNLIKTAKSLYL